VGVVAIPLANFQVASFRLFQDLLRLSSRYPPTFEPNECFHSLTAQHPAERRRPFHPTSTIVLDTSTGGLRNPWNSLPDTTLHPYPLP
jgi:hypothetical protein